MILIPPFRTLNRPESTYPILVEYLDIQDSEGLPVFTFYTKDSVNSGNNTGWGFL